MSATTELLDCEVTFEELVRFGLAKCKSEGREANIVNGMPWSFTFQGMHVSHENDRCYLVCTGVCPSLRFEPEDLLVIKDGAVRLDKGNQKTS